MKPEFIHPKLWAALPEDIQEGVLSRGAQYFRSGDEPEVAFWIALNEEERFLTSVEDYVLMEKDDAEDLVTDWQLRSVGDAIAKQSSMDILLRIYGYSMKDADGLFALDSAEQLWEVVTEDLDMEGRCLSCGKPTSGTDPLPFGSCEVHQTCSEAMEKVSYDLWLNARKRSGLAIVMEELNTENSEDGTLTMPDFLGIFDEPAGVS